MSPCVAAGGAAAALCADPLRLTIAVQRLGMTGYQAAAELDARHGVAVELANHAVCVWGRVTPLSL